MKRPWKRLEIKLWMHVPTGSLVFLAGGTWRIYAKDKQLAKRIGAHGMITRRLAMNAVERAAA